MYMTVTGMERAADDVYMATLVLLSSTLKDPLQAEIYHYH